jgi:hypothetical protein
MFVALYILYAFVQAILVARYVIQDQTAPVLLVLVMTIFAPIASIGMIIHYGGAAIAWLVTYRPKK